MLMIPIAKYWIVIAKNDTQQKHNDHVNYTKYCNDSRNVVVIKKHINKNQQQTSLKKEKPQIRNMKLYNTKY